MKTPRSTALAERLIAITAAVLLSGLIGYMIAEYSRPIPPVRECPKFEYKPQAYPLSREERRQFINYYRKGETK